MPARITFCGTLAQVRGGLQRRTRSPPLLTFGTFGHAKVHLRSCGVSKPPPYEAAVGFASRRHSRREPQPAFSLEAQAQRKSYNKETPKKVSPSAECDKGSEPLTAPPLKRRAKLLVASPKLPTLATHLRESARLPRASMFARAMWLKRREQAPAHIATTKKPVASATGFYLLLYFQRLSGYSPAAFICSAKSVNISLSSRYVTPCHTDVVSITVTSAFPLSIIS